MKIVLDKISHIMIF